MDAKIYEALKNLLPELSDSTRQQYYYQLRRLLKFAGVKKVKAVTFDGLHDFLVDAANRYSPRTCAGIYTALRHIFNAVYGDSLPKEFARLLSTRPKQPKTLPGGEYDILTEATIRQWCENAPPAYQAACALLYEPGLSMAQAVSLTPESVIHYGSQVIVDGKRLPVWSPFRSRLFRQAQLAKAQEQVWLIPSPRGGHVGAAALKKALHDAKPPELGDGYGVRCLRGSYLLHQFSRGRGPAELMWQLGLSPHQMGLYLKKYQNNS